MAYGADVEGDMGAVTPAAVWHHEAGPEGAGLIVLVHGAMDRSSSLVRLSRALDQRYRVLRYDRRGYARSHRCPGPYSMAGHVADLVALVGDRPALLVGHSYGGNVALAASTELPNVLGAVVYENPLSWMTWWPGMSRRIDPSVPGAVVAENFMRRVVGHDVWDALPTSVQDQRRAEGDTLLAELADLAHEPWRAEQLTAPVVAMCGEHTAEHHRAGVEVMSDVTGGRPPVIVAGAGHNGPSTHAPDVAAVVAALAIEVGLLAASAAAPEP